ncbi:Mkk2p [Rhizophagus irregularis DAOM 197198w]|uniref:Mkk2p n=3 Tax=Rhizophagus irregularis TaxID=588596 RepID=A0A015N688_RHIIW|nr:Mkk2p [Rhizophagus irregularis DAOM 197198w]
MVTQDLYCVKCGKKFTDAWCKPCQINDLEKNFTNWTSGNEKINNLIQGMQLKIKNYNDIIVEWIPYDQLNDIKELGKDELTTIYSAMWKDGLLKYDRNKYEYSRNQNIRVSLKLYKSQNITNEFLNEVEIYFNRNHLYGISQNPYTKCYIILFLYGVYCDKCGESFIDTYSRWCKWCKPCQINDLKKNFTNWSSGNEKIDNLIQERQLKINSHNDIIAEWIPYDQFNYMKELEKDEFATIYFAIWKDGPLQYDTNKHNYSRKRSKKVNLKLYNSQNSINGFLNEVNSNELEIYGISQNSDTKNYILVLQNVYCDKCGKVFTDKWCEPCQINELLENNLMKLTSKNEKIVNLIRKMQSKIKSYNDIVFEWIPYNQFDEIKEIGKGGFAIVYSAMWKDGPLHYNTEEHNYTRNQNKVVALKCLYNSQNITSELLNEVELYSIKNHENYYEENKILKIYGISQNPDTKEYIIVLDYAKGGNFNYWMNKNFNNLEWPKKVTILYNISMGLKELHQKKMVHRDFHTGNILLNTAGVTNNMDDSVIHISDMGLCGDASNTNQNNIYGVIPYVAPEVLKGEPYTQAADIYSFGMIMYFVATGKQPFADRAHDEYLVLNICNGIRPEINVPIAPKYYIDLMKKCLDSNPYNRPKASEILKLIHLFIDLYKYDGSNFNYQIAKEFKEAEEYRRSHLSSFNKENTHPQAIYESRLLNPFTKKLQKYDNIDNNTVEIIDFTK